jgi:starch synthase
MVSPLMGPRASPLTTPSGTPVGVVHLVAEYLPYARTGGLADAVRSLTAWQASIGLPTVVVLPLYRCVREQVPGLGAGALEFDIAIGPTTERIALLPNPGPTDGPRVWFLDHPRSFDRPGIYGEGADYPDNARRFAIYCRGALAALPRIAPGPQVVHAHDWHTALAPVYLRTVLASEAYYRQLACVLSVHNAGYQGHFSQATLAELGLPAALWHWQKMEWYGQLNILKGGLVFSDAVATVSPTHAHELRTPAGGFGLHDAFIDLKDRLVGILNGINVEEWDPATDPDIPARYSREALAGKAACKAALQRALGLAEDPALPLFGMTARLVKQKGLDILLASRFSHETEAQYVFLGEGEVGYANALYVLATESPDRVAAEFEFTEHREHQLMAGADLFLMPSLYEPCGLTQMRAQRYGAIPVARRVGGLADTIEDGVTGFLFDDYSADALLVACRRAIAQYGDRESWTTIMREAMARDWSWGRSGGRYLDLYRRAVAMHHAGRRN